MANKKTNPSFLPLLHQVVKFLNTGTPEAAKLWAVLTALRGPDSALPGSTYSEWDEQKRATTAVIRHTLGLKAGIANGIIVAEDSDEAAALRFRQHVNSVHFDYHARTAFEALGLKWTTVNKKAPLLVVPRKKR